MSNQGEAFLGGELEASIIEEATGLYGLQNSNRDFSDKRQWGKNIFNNAFPISLACYMADKGLSPYLLTTNSKGQINSSKTSFSVIFGTHHKDVYYHFETAFSPYQKLTNGFLPRVDLVTKTMEDGSLDSALRALEIKLTVTPDASTASLPPELWSCELVVRPDTIAYLALSLAQRLSREQIDAEFINLVKGTNLDNASSLLAKAPQMAEKLNQLLDLVRTQPVKPLMLQPIWKTEGQTPVLAENCFDMVVWSDLALAQLLVNSARETNSTTGALEMSRICRSLLWLTSMLADYAANGTIDLKKHLSNFAAGPKNDKAFSLNGRKMREVMPVEALANPRVSKDALKEIIQGDVANLLQPERRLDACIVLDAVQDKA